MAVRSALAFTLLFIVVALAASPCVASAPLPKVKNVIMLVGDGMGPSQMELARVVYGVSLADGFTSIGVAYTSSLNAIVTDSAAAATAFATGFRTNNRVISMVPVEGHLVPVMTLLELAKKLGKSVGLVTTTRVTDATPAAFAAHVADRGMEREIAEQMLRLGVDVILGGGKKCFSKALLDAAERNGYALLFTREQLLEALNRTPAKVLGLFSESHIPFVLDRRGEYPSLVEMTALALKVLSRNPNGFFLMVEGGRIDHACHLNDAASAAAETKEFCETVKLALAFAAKHPGTLVVVLADHETGGLAVGNVNVEGMLKVKASALRMAEEVAKGEDPARVVMELAGVKLSREEAAMVKEACAESLWRCARIIGRIVSEKLGVRWATYHHTAEPVLVLAYGPGANSFEGVYHLAEIAKKVAKLMLFGALKEPLLLGASPIPGDLNGDHVVNWKDAYIALEFLGSRAKAEPLARMDVNGNGLVDLEDVYVMYRGEVAEAILGKLTMISRYVVEKLVAAP